MMFWKWFWNKEENISEPIYEMTLLPNSFSMKEIIITTVRNRIYKYHIEELNINNTDTMAEEIWEEYEKWYSNVSDSKSAIDGLISICERYETKMREGTFASIKEYGR